MDLLRTILKIFGSTIFNFQRFKQIFNTAKLLRVTLNRCLISAQRSWFTIRNRIIHTSQWWDKISNCNPLENRRVYLSCFLSDSVDTFVARSIPSPPPPSPRQTAYSSAAHEREKFHSTHGYPLSSIHRASNLSRLAFIDHPRRNLVQTCRDSIAFRELAPTSTCANDRSRTDSAIIHDHSSKTRKEKRYCSKSLHFEFIRICASLKPHSFYFHPFFLPTKLTRTTFYSSTFYSGRNHHRRFVRESSTLGLAKQRVFTYLETEQLKERTAISILYLWERTLHVTGLE